jgi:hypothetical protein
MTRRLLATLAGLLLPFAVCAAQSLQAEPPAIAEKPGHWLEGASEHFVVYSSLSERVMRDYIGMLEDFDHQLRLLFDLSDKPVPRKLPVYLLSDLNQLRRISPGMDKNFAGYYMAASDDIFAVAIRQSALSLNDRSDSRKGDDIVLHEYMHHFMLQYFPASYPGWMIEGLAEYYMTADLQATKVTVGGFNRGRLHDLVNGRWLQMEDILRKKVGELEPGEIPLYYAQAGLLTHYVWSDPTRRKQLDGFLARIRNGDDAVDAWSKVYGDDPKALRSKLQSYVRGPHLEVQISREPPPPAQIVFRQLPAVADDLILEAQQLKQGVAADNRAKLLEQIRAAAAAHPGERYGRLVLARAETKLGDRARGRQLLDALLTEQPQNLEALQLMAFNYLWQANDEPDNGKALRAEAARYLVRASKIDPDNYLTLYGYALARSRDGELSENTLDAFYRAAKLAPQSTEIRMNAASAFLFAKDYASAREMLEPVATNPHGGDAATTAAAMLKSIPAED